MCVCVAVGQVRDPHSVVAKQPREDVPFAKLIHGPEGRPVFGAEE